MLQHFAKPILLGTIISFVGVIKISGQNLLWAKQTGGTGSDYGNAIAADAEGNVLVATQIFGTADIDPGPAENLMTSAGFHDIVIAKYDTDGNLLWGNQYGGTGADRPVDIETDSDGNIIVVGQFRETADFDPTEETNLYTAAGSNDIVILKIDPNGETLWVAQIGGTEGDNVSCVEVDPNNNILIGGEFSGTVDFDPGADTYPASDPDDTNPFILQLDAEGNFMNMVQYSIEGVGLVADIQTTASGDYVACGTFSGTADFSATPFPAVFTSLAYDSFIIHLSSMLGTNWGIAFGGAGFDLIKSIATTADGSIYATGSFIQTVDFDPGSGETLLTANGGYEDIFITKYNSNGELLWAKSCGGDDNDTGFSIVPKSTGDIIIAGGFKETIDFDPGSGVYEVESAGQYDAFILSLSPDGNFLWAGGVGDIGQDQFKSLAIDSNDNVHLIGHFTGSIDADPGSGMFSLTSAGSEDIIMMKLGANGSTDLLEMMIRREYLIYPNPTQNSISLLHSNDDPFDFIIVDSYGKICSTGAGQENLKIASEQLSPGRYNIEINPFGQKKITTGMIKQ